MKPIQNLSASPAAAAVCCDVTAHGTVRLPGEELHALRSQLGALLGRPLSNSFLKHTDDQTVAALGAVGYAMQRHNLGGTPFADWGVLAAPRFLGRTTMVGALQRFAAEGAWGVSPHLIPHRSLHSISGTISQALEIHGPNFGVGGGPGCASEVFLAAAAMAERDRLPGIWLILTGYDAEPDQAQAPGTQHTCGAVALALRKAQPSWRGLRLRVALEPAAPRGRAAAHSPPISVEALLDWLTREPAPSGRGSFRLEGGGGVELEHVGAALRGREAALERLAS